jgi:hypothetical protein
MNATHLVLKEGCFRRIDVHTRTATMHEDDRPTAQPTIARA